MDIIIVEEDKGRDSVSQYPYVCTECMKKFHTEVAEHNDRKCSSCGEKLKNIKK